jgi:large subunit ribosomal protein L18
MVNRKPKTVQYRRRRESKTDYGKRLRLLTSTKPRVIVRFTNNKIIAQVIEFTSKGDIVKVGISSDSLKKLGWSASTKNLPAAYLTGYLLAKNAAKAGVKEAILDTGLKRPLHKGKIFAFLKGVIEGGLNVPHSEDVFPNNDRIEGQHLKNDIKEQFSKVKQGLAS